MSTDRSKALTDNRIPLATIFKILAAIAVVKMLGLLIPILMPLAIGSLLAISLTPILNWLTRKRLPRSVGILLIALTLAAVVALVLSMVIPQIYHEGTGVVEKYPQYRTDLINQFPESSPIRSFVENLTDTQRMVPKVNDVKGVLGASNVLLGGFLEIFLVFVFSLYLLIDGPRAFTWVSAFFSAKTQSKIEETAQGISDIVFAYVSGQAINSALSFTYVLTVLSILHVPSALLLATLSATLDVLPVLGFVLAVVPAMLFSLAVSPDTSLIVLGLYILYHVLENYLIVPLVYGNRLRLNGFVVFFFAFVGRTYRRNGRSNRRFASRGLIPNH